MIETYFPSIYFDINFWNKKQLSFRFQKMNRKCTACTVISKQQPEIMQHGAMFYFSATYEKKADDLQQNYLRIHCLMRSTRTNSCLERPFYYA